MEMKPVEEKRAFLRIDLRYLKAIADDGICRRTAALAQDLQFIAGMLDDLVDRQEIGGVFLLADKIEFIVDLRL